MSLKPKVLLVDDEKRFVESLQEILEYYDYDCQHALCGQDAIEHLRRGEYEIALLDIGLPDVSGCEVAEFIARSCQYTTAVMLTGLNTVDTAVEAMKNGAYDFLSKPVDPDKLLLTLEKAREHSLLKRELIASQKRFKTLAEVACEGIVILDGHYLLEANKQFYTMFGYSEEKLDGVDVLKTIFTPESLQTVSIGSGDAKPSQFEVKGIHKNGQELYLEIKTCTIKFREKQARVMNIRDITKRIEAEQEKLDLERKFAKARKLNELGLMAGAVAHDLNNILTAVVSYPDLLLKQMDETDPYYREISKIQKAGKQAAAVVKDLVSIARGGVREKVVADLNDIIRDYLDSIEHSESLQQFPDIYVQTHLASKSADIDCSPVHIRKLLLNLINNALESMVQHGTVKIKTENCCLEKGSESFQPILPDGNYVRLTIADNGPGVSPEDRENIFTPFYSTKDNHKSGTGLGLSVVWNVVQEHKGWIEVKDNNPGASFEIYFPLSARKSAPSPETNVLHESLRGKGEKILLVDDREEQNIVMKKMLDVLGYEAHAVSSGEQAIDYLSQNNADLVFLDMMMGDGINGRETYEEILKINPRQKAILISGYCDIKEIEKAKELGIETCLEKPVAVSKLSTEIQKTLAKDHGVNGV